MSAEATDDLDAILNDALDDLGLDDDDDSDSAEDPAVAPQPQAASTAASMTGGPTRSTSGLDLDSLLESVIDETKENEPNDRTMQDMADLLARTAKDQAAQNSSGGGDGSLADMFSDPLFANMIQKMMTLDTENPEDGMEVMMLELLKVIFTKEIMREPIHNICTRYPTWIEEHKETLSAADLENYSKQLKCFEQLLAILDSQEDGVEPPTEQRADVMRICNEMMEYGHVPDEILKELMDGMDPNDMGFQSLFGMGADASPGAMPQPGSGPELDQLLGNMSSEERAEFEQIQQAFAKETDTCNMQ